MSRFIALFGVLFVTCITITSAAPLNNDLTVENFGMEFSLTTMDLGVPVRAVQTKCDDAANHICQYVTDGQIALMATDDEQADLATDIVMIFAGGSDPDEILPTMAGIITTVFPNISANDRGKIVKETLLRATTEKLPKATYTHEGVKFTMTISDAIGIMFLVARD